MINVKDAALFSEYNGSQMESDHIILGWGSGLSKIPNETSGTIAKITFKILDESYDDAEERRALEETVKRLEVLPGR